MAPRRSVPDDQGPEALALAGRRPGWLRARRLGPEPARQEGRQAPAPQAAEKAGPGPACDDHGQAGQLRRRQRRGDALRRAPKAQGLVWGHRCQGSSSAAAFLRVYSAGRRLRANPRGARHRARVIAPRACIRWAAWGPNHDAAMRIGGEAPGRRVQPKQRLWGHSLVRHTATSDHPRQLTTRTRMSAEAFTSWTAGA